MTSTTPRIALRDILRGQRAIIASSVFDAVSARLAKHIGSPVGVLGGSAASQVVLGAPDIVLLTATELVEQTRRICRTDCVDLIVDADHGYGNALNVARTITELQAAGAAAVCVEDSVLPREFGSGQQQGLVSIEEGSKKLRAALLARGDGSMLILARTNAAGTVGVDEAVKRLSTYQELGVDALFAPYLKSREELDAIAKVARLPIIVAGASAELFDLDYLSSRGVKIWVWGHQPYALALRTLHDAMHALHHGKRPDQLGISAVADLLNVAMDTEHYEQLAREFLK